MKDHLTRWQELVSSGHPVIWVETCEDERAIRTLCALSGLYSCVSWDLVDGLFDYRTNTQTPLPDPRKAIESLNNMPENSILFIKDAHRYVREIPIFRAIKNNMGKWKGQDKHLVLLAIDTNIPRELEKEVKLYIFPLPSSHEILTLAKALARTNAERQPGQFAAEVDEEVGAAGVGLTSQEAEDAISLSLLVHGEVKAAVLQEAKLEIIKKSGLLELYPPVPEEEVGGLDLLKEYLRARKVAFQQADMPRLRGILLVGAPGCGKSLSAKAAASILNMPLIRLDLAALKGSLVGQSEQNLRSALKLLDAVSGETGAVVWLDEIDKFMQSAQVQSESATPNMLSTLFTWCQESRSKTYLVATCNDIDAIVQVSQGALLRRFDDVFFVDLPTARERFEIAQIMVKKYNAQNSDQLPQMMMLTRYSGWTGAEIEKLVINSIFEGGIVEAERNIHPVSRASESNIQRMRTWAQQNARPANKPDETLETTRTIARR